MIKAKHAVWAKLLFYPYMNRLIRNNFSGFYLVNDFPDIPEDKSLIITPNHISWWDGFFAQYTFSKYTNRKMHIMMLEEQLKNYPFFRRLGAFSVDPGNPKSIINTSSYIKSLLEDKGNYVVAFPQGEIESFEKHPLSLKRGLRFFTKDINPNCVVLPAAFKIQYYNQKRPVVIVRFGDISEAKEVTENYYDYMCLFHENITFLAEASFYKKFKMNLFDK